MERSVKIVFVAMFSIVIVFSYGQGVLGYRNIIEEGKDENSCFSDIITIVAFGNSITAVNKKVHKVYSQRLPDLLNNYGFETKVINSGLSGSHTGHIWDNSDPQIRHALDRFESDVLVYNPDIVIIGFGTNDAHIDSNKRNGKSRISLDMYRNNLEYMINQLLSNRIKVIMIAPNVLGKRYEKFQNKRLLKYVRVVRHLVRKYELGLVDNYRLFLDYQKMTENSFDILMYDGIHPNDQGHEIIANELVKEVVKVSKSSVVK